MVLFCSTTRMENLFHEEGNKQRKSEAHVLLQCTKLPKILQYSTKRELSGIPMHNNQLEYCMGKKNSNRMQSGPSR